MPPFMSFFVFINDLWRFGVDIIETLIGAALIILVGLGLGDMFDFFPG